MSELAKYTAGDQVPSRRDRDAAKRARKIYDDARVAAYEAEATAALAKHIMGEAKDIDDTRRALAGNDPILNSMMADIEATALLQERQIQRRLTNNWGL